MSNDKEPARRWLIKKGDIAEVTSQARLVSPGRGLISYELSRTTNTRGALSILATVISRSKSVRIRADFLFYKIKNVRWKKWTNS